MPRVEVWEAVALSCDVDPKQHADRTFLDDFRQHLRYEPGAAVASLREKFQSRCDVAESNIQGRVLEPASYDGYDLLHCSIDFPIFARWAIDVVGWNDAPQEFKEIADNASATPAQTPRAVLNEREGLRGQWPWGSYETPLLNQLRAAAEKFWLNYDPTDPSTAATSDAVIAWLRSRGVAERVAEIMAQILRDPNLPSGPRR